MLKVIKKNRLIVSPFTMRAFFLGLKARGKVYKKKAACFRRPEGWCSRIRRLLLLLVRKPPSILSAGGKKKKKREDVIRLK